MIAAVLVGGQSTRFGRDKLFFKINGKILLLYTLERLKKARRIERIVLIASPHSAKKLKKLGYPVLVDELSIGPIGGIYTALKLGDSFIVAGDMPMLVPEFVDFILECFEKTKKQICVPRWNNGYIEPLHAAYSSSFRKVLEERIKAGNYAINRAIREVDPFYVEIENLPERWRISFFNVNTRKDAERIKAKRL